MGETVPRRDSTWERQYMGKTIPGRDRIWETVCGRVNGTVYGRDSIWRRKYLGEIVYGGDNTRQRTYSAKDNISGRGTLVFGRESDVDVLTCHFHSRLMHSDTNTPFHARHGGAAAWLAGVTWGGGVTKVGRGRAHLYKAALLVPGECGVMRRLLGGYWEATGRV